MASVRFDFWNFNGDVVVVVELTTEAAANSMARLKILCLQKDPLVYHQQMNHLSCQCFHQQAHPSLSYINVLHFFCSR
ncbi:hypothetical protein M5689_008132 [Euphorbia peplus]|nr:hypothetical protein M5689_008132 [Euphorbia peplus]